MLTNNRLFSLWCVLAGGILLVSTLPGSTSIYQFIAPFDANRWIHFFAYASIAAIPVAGWRSKSNVLLSFILPILSIVLELVQSHLPGSPVRGQNVPADLFGMAAGILLGWNIRTIRNSARSLGSINSDESHSETI